MEREVAAEVQKKEKNKLLKDLSKMTMEDRKNVYFLKFNFFSFKIKKTFGRVKSFNYICFCLRQR